MKNRMIILLILLVMANLAKCAEPNFTIEIIPQTKEIRVGEFFIFELVCKFEQPLISPDSNEFRKYFELYPYLTIDHEEGTFSIEKDKLFPQDLYLRQGREKEY